MEKVCGVVQLTAPKTVSWRIGNKNAVGRWVTSTFTFSSPALHSNIFCFLIEPNKKKIESGKLYLYEAISGVSKTWDLIISLIYSHETKTLVKKNKKPVKNGTWFVYDLATIETNNLLEITCTFLKSGVWNETVQVIGNASVAETGESSKKRKHEGSSTVVAESSTVVAESSSVVAESSSVVEKSSTVVEKSSTVVEGSSTVEEETSTVKQNKRLNTRGSKKRKHEGSSTVVAESSSVVGKSSTVVEKSSTVVKGSSTVEEESSTVKQNKRLNTRGLDALSENLKDAFLSAEDTDVVIKIGDKEYRAHKVILKNRSPVFCSMLKYDMVEKNQGTIDISDCDPDIFRDFLLYLYTGKVDCISKRNVFELYYMSDKYDVETLKLDCVDFVLNHLDIDIICNVIALATRHLEQEMLKHAISFFTDNAKEIFLTSNWQKFIKEYPIQANELIIKAFNGKS